MKKENIFDLEPYKFSGQQKNKFISENIYKLTHHHFKKNIQYKKILNFLKFKFNKNNKIEDYPFIPVRLFKYYDLLSIEKEKIFKTLMSSGTSENLPSKIFLDKENSFNQTKVLSKIMKSVLGDKRLPMMIIDRDITKVDRNNFNAKVAAIKGFSVFGKEYCYILNDDEKINYNVIDSFLDKYGKKPFFIFGFTYNIYKYLIKEFNNHKYKYDFKNGILIHGGGWKKMEDVKIDNENFKKLLKDNINLKNVHNYYGLIEQTGSIFIECKKCSSFITSIFSDVLIRDKHMNELPSGKTGFIQLISILPKSYPGHVILTEDLGRIVNNNCSCKNRGKRFKVIGRSKKSEIRGCSNI